MFPFLHYDYDKMAFLDKMKFFKKNKNDGSSQPSMSWNTWGSGLPFLGCLQNGSYDNNFSSVARIAESFAEVMPFAVDEKGERLDPQPALMNAIFNPNEEMSGHEFIESLATMMLVHPLVYVLAWRREGKDVLPGGPITAENLAGFTFLENASAIRLNGRTVFQSSDGRIWTKNDVLVFSMNVNPYALLNGYSPSIAAKKWATVDDYVADYQAGYFRNGAVPAGQMVVTAATAEDFNKTVDQLQAHHRGAKNANNIIYVHRPTSSIDGKPLSASVEWIPFAEESKDKALQSLFDQSNKKIDMTFGVPQEIKGYLSNSNYASVEVANYVFERYVLYPKLVKVWSKFTHELNRITGGLGFALSFDFELPVLTDALSGQVNSLSVLLDKGFTVESAVKALKLPPSFSELEKMDVLGSVDTPTRDQKDIKAKAIDDITEGSGNDKPEVNQQLVALLASYISEIINEAIKRLREDNPDEPLTEETLLNWLVESGYSKQVASLIIAILMAIINIVGQEELNKFIQDLGISNEILNMTERERQELQERVEDLILKFGEETIAEIMKTVGAAVESGEDTAATVAALMALKDADYYRAERWAESEQHRAEELATVIAAVQVQNSNPGVMAYKTWRINPSSPDICAFCVRMNGETVPMDEPFSNGDMVPHYHPYCYCTMEVSFRQTGKSVKVVCPNCGRYMCESSGGNIKGIICANSKCKKRYDIEIVKGEVKAKEVKKEA